MVNQPVHDNAVRQEWLSKISGLNTLEKGVEVLTAFRKTSTTPLRESYALELDCNWIECKLEEQVAQLKLHAQGGEKFFTLTAQGDDAQTVANAWTQRMADCNDKWEAEKIHINFRLMFKPPMMPVNIFMDADRILGSRLMELRNLNYYDTPLTELRKQRGVKVVHLQAETSH
ncbi:MAG: methane monooxygenase [Methylococcaceae bacterium]|nr:methane monooxygenase [Methylococcaceae bacterium]